MRPKQIIFLSLLITTAFIAVNLSIDKRDLSGDFTSTEIRQIELGMELEEVQNILGKPYQITSLAGLHELTCERPKSRLTKDINSEIDIK